MLRNEDPSFTVLNDPELHQTVLSGQGELHLTVVIKRLKERFGVEVTEERPKIPYRETITAKADEKYRHKSRAAAGPVRRGVDAHRTARPGKRVRIQERGVRRAYFGVVHPSIEKGVRQVLETGPMAGHRVWTSGPSYTTARNTRSIRRTSRSRSPAGKFSSCWCLTPNPSCLNRSTTSRSRFLKTAWATSWAIYRGGAAKSWVWTPRGIFKSSR